MSLFRRRAAPPSRRQMAHSDDLTPAPASLMYRSRRSGAARNVDRQMSPAASITGRRQPAVYFWLQRFGLAVLFVATAASLINVLSLSTTANVVPLSQANNRSLLRPTAVYQQAATGQLGRSIWNRNKITIDTNQVAQQLLNQFPELNSVSVTIPLLAHRPLVYIEPAQPALILVTNGGSFLVDTTGKALLAAGSPAVLQQPALAVVNDQTGLVARLNHQVLSTDTVGFIQTVITQLAAKRFTVSSMSLPPAASELDVHLSGQPYFVKFNLQSTNPRGQAGTFLATISQLHRQNISPSQYVDVRVDGRAYYK